MNSDSRLSFERYLGYISSEAERLAGVTVDALDSRIPSCPEWHGRELLDHVWHVFTFWNRQVVTGDVTSPDDLGERSMPTADAPGDWVEDAAARLVGALADAGPDAPCWNWSGEDLEVAWVARRMALETAVHRYDGELAAGVPTAVDAELAVDGIDERLDVHLRSDVPKEPAATLGGSLCLACSDRDRAWVVEVGGGHLKIREGSGPASACLRAGASDLFLFTWNRIAVDELELTGDRAVATAWATLPV
jgi:uncharacterized protein (TIGR03083 family)